MIQAVIGLLVLTGSIALLWALLPKDGKLNRWATAPILESALPLVIVCGFALGLALLFSVRV